MNLELQDVGPEYLKQPPFARVMWEDVEDQPGHQIPHLTTNALWPVEAIKTFYIGINMLEEELDDSEREELDEWIAQNRD